MGASQSALSATAGGVPIGLLISQSDATCKVPQELNFSEPLRPNGYLHFQGALRAIAGTTGGLGLLFLSYLTFNHLFNFVQPQEQKQLIRVISCIALYIICSFVSVVAYDSARFLEPIPAFWEAFAVASLFFFYTSAVTGKHGVSSQFYTKLDRTRKNNFQRTEKSDMRDMRWFHWHWILVFQLLLGRLGSLIAYEYLEAHLCEYSKDLRRRTTALRIVELIQLIIAVAAVIHFLFAMRRSFKPHHREHAKLWTFKLSIIIIAVQQFIFQTLSSRLIWKPTAHVSFRDLQIGVPNMLVCCELFVTSLVMLWSYSPSEYIRLSEYSQLERTGFFRALWQVINITDLIVGGFYGLIGLIPDKILPKKLSCRANIRNSHDNYPETSEDSLQKEHVQDKPPVYNQPWTETAA